MMGTLCTSFISYFLYHELDVKVGRKKYQSRESSGSNSETDGPPHAKTRKLDGAAKYHTIGSILEMAMYY